MAASSDARVRQSLPDAPTTLLFCASAGLLAVGAPMFAYLVVLGTFGVAQAIWALRHIRTHFANRAPPGLWTAVAVLATLAASVRVAAHLGTVGPELTATIELFLIVAMVVPTLRLALPGAGVFGAALSGGLALLAIGSLQDPLLTVQTLRTVHLLSPLALLFAAVPRGSARRSIAVGGLLAFAPIPLLIAGGLPTHLLNSVGLSRPDLSPLPLGPLTQQLPHFVPSWMLDHPRAPDFFRARTYLEIVHCAVILTILPSVPGPARPRLALSLPALAIATTAAAGASIWGLFDSFHNTRAVIELVSDLEAYVELPVLALALGAVSRPQTAPQTG